MRGLLAFALVVTVATPAVAVDYTLLRWKKTGQCEIVTHLPMWGDHWVALGNYNSQAEAERALAKNRKLRACPVAKSAKRTESPLDQRKSALTYRGERAEPRR